MFCNHLCNLFFTSGHHTVFLRILKNVTSESEFKREELVQKSPKEGIIIDLLLINENMSLIARANPVRVMAKRKISFSITPDFQSINTTQPQDHQIQQESTTTNELSSIKVSEYLQTISHAPQRYKTAQINARNLGKTGVNSIPLTFEQAKYGSEIRRYIETKNYRKLLDVAKSLSTSRNFAPLLNYLTRQELTLFFKILIEGQRSVEAEEILQIRFLLKTQDEIELNNQVKESAYIISSLYLTLLKMNVKFTPYEYELFLTLETNNLRLAQAVDLIRYIDEKKIPKTIKFWNLKLKVIGEADPANWKIFNDYHTLSKRGIAGGFEFSHKTEFGNLLTEFSEDIGDVVPNYETHQLILLGAGKAKNLDLMRYHMEDVWGIVPQNSGKESKKIVTSKSALYPELSLLSSLIAAFGYNDALFEVLYYINEFQVLYKLDLSRAHWFWKTLLLWSGMRYSAEPEKSAEIFDGIWGLMNNNHVTFNFGLFEYRRQRLVELNKLDELIEDTKKTRLEITKSFQSLHFAKCQELLTRQYRGCCAIAFATNVDKDINLKHLANGIAIDKKHKKELFKAHNEAADKALAERSKFESLQKEYDEQDEENALW